ncbi:MAG: HEPN domain-containing protein [Chloroflexota bacterium]
MNTPDEVAYHMALAEGFLSEAEQDKDLKRWRSCVDNAQLSAENSGKSVLALFQIVPKSHDPAKEIAVIIRNQRLPDSIRDKLQQLLPDLLALGLREHFLTDYGDETTYTLPWDLFTQESGQEALGAARSSIAKARGVIDSVARWRAGESK